MPLLPMMHWLAIPEGIDKDQTAQSVQSGLFHQLFLKMLSVLLV